MNRVSFHKTKHADYVQEALRNREGEHSSWENNAKKYSLDVSCELALATLGLFVPCPLAVRVGHSFTSHSHVPNSGMEQLL